MTQETVTIWNQPLDDFCIVGCILNFIQKAGDNFLNGCDFYGINFTSLLLNLIQKIGEKSFQPVTKIILKNKKNNATYDEMDFMMVMRCLIGLMENNKGKIDHLMPQIVKIVVELILGQERTRYFRKFLYQVIATMLWYNINGVFQVMATDPFNEQNAITVLQGFQENMLEYTNETERERILHGINAILSLGPNSIPPCIDLKKLMNAAVTLSTQIIHDRNHPYEDDNMGDFDKGMNTEILESENNLDLSEWYLLEKAKAESRQRAKENGDNVDMSDDESVWDGEDDILDAVDQFDYESPLENICPILQLQNGLQYLQNTNGDWAAQLANFLDGGAKDQLGVAFNEADRLFKEKQNNERNNFNANMGNNMKSSA